MLEQTCMEIFLKISQLVQFQLFSPRGSFLLAVLLKAKAIAFCRLATGSRSLGSCWRIESKALGRKNSYVSAACAAVAGAALVASTVFGGSALADGPAIGGKAAEAQPAPGDRQSVTGPDSSSPATNPKNTRESAPVEGEGSPAGASARRTDERQVSGSNPAASNAEEALPESAQKPPAQGEGVQKSAQRKENPAAAQTAPTAGYYRASGAQEFCKPGSITWIESANGSLENFQLQGNRVTSGPRNLAIIERRTRPNITGAGQGYDALGISPDGTVFHAEHRATKSTHTGTSAPVYISRGVVVNGQYQRLETIKVLGAGMPFSGGTVSPQGQYVVAGDALQNNASPRRQIRVLAYDPKRNSVSSLGNFWVDNMPSAKLLTDLLFDSRGNLYVLAASAEGNTKWISGNEKLKVNIYRIDYARALQNAQRSWTSSVGGRGNNKTVSVRTQGEPALDAQLVRSVNVTNSGIPGWPYKGMAYWEANGFAAGADGSFYLSAVYTRAPNRKQLFKLGLNDNSLRPVYQMPEPRNAGGYDFRFGSKMTDLEGCGAALPTIRAAKVVQSRAAGADSFKVNVYEERNRQSQNKSADTGRGNRAETDSLVRDNATSYVVEERMGARSASKLTAYDKNVTCTDGAGIVRPARVIENSEHRFAARVTGSGSGDLTCTITNGAPRGEVTAVKYDADSMARAGATDEASMPSEARLAGVDLQLCKDSNGNQRCDGNEERIGATQKTDGRGEATWRNLAPGNYVVVEPASPKGYQQTDGIPVRVQAGGPRPSRVLVPNHRIKGRVTWTKVDAESGKPLAGSTWQINGNDNSQDTSPKHRVIRHVTIEDCVAGAANRCKGPDKDPRGGHFALTEMGWGNYFLREVKAPVAYKLNRRVHRVDIYPSEGKTNVALGNIKNEKQDVPPLPFTGGVGSDIFYLVGGIVAASAGAGWLLRRKNS